MKARPRFVVCERISVDRRSLSSDGSLSFSRCFRSARGLCRDAFRSAVCYESACREGVRRCAPAGVGATEPELCEDTADPAPRPPRSLGSVTLKSRCLAFYFEFASRFRFFIYVSRRGAFPRFAPVRAPWPLGAARAAGPRRSRASARAFHSTRTGPEPRPEVIHALSHHATWAARHRGAAARGRTCTSTIDIPSRIRGVRDSRHPRASIPPMACADSM